MGRSLGRRSGWTSILSDRCVVLPAGPDLERSPGVRPANLFCLWFLFAIVFDMLLAMHYLFVNIRNLPWMFSVWAVLSKWNLTWVFPYWLRANSIPTLSVPHLVLTHHEHRAVQGQAIV